MSRKSTAPAAPPTSKTEAPPAPPAAELIDLDPAPPDDDDKLDFFEYLKTLEDRVLRKTVVYVYRLSPKIKKTGAHHIDKYAAHLFSEDVLKEDHGGGRYRLYLDTGSKDTQLSRHIEIVGTPAKLYPEEIRVDDQGNPIPVQTSAAASSPADGAQSDIVRVLQTVTAALEKNQSSPAKAIEEALAVMKAANVGAVEIMANAAKAASAKEGGSAGDQAVLSEIRNLAAAIRDMKKGPEGGVADKVMNAALERLINPPPPAPAPDIFEGLKKLADITGGGEGGLGVLRTLLSGDRTSFWEKAAETLVGGISTAISENFPAIMQWARERSWYAHMERQRREQAAQAAGHPGAPANVPQPPPVPPSRVPLPTPTPAPPAPAPPAPPSGDEETEMLAMMQREITALIRRCWDRAIQEEETPDGYSAAAVVKLAYPIALPFIRSTFTDLEKLKQLAKVDTVLGPIATHVSFDQFAKDFFEEIHNTEAGETAAGNA